MLVVQRPKSFDAMTVAADSTEDDFRTLAGDDSEQIHVFKAGGQYMVMSEAAPDWTGRFAPGDLIYYADPVFLKLEPASEYVEYRKIYVPPTGNALSAEA